MGTAKDDINGNYVAGSAEGSDLSNLDDTVLLSTHFS